MSGCEHPGMIKPGMVDVSEFELIKCSVLSGFELTNYHVSSELERHDLTIEQVLNKYPNVTQFKVKNWIEGSVGDAKNKPRHIELIDGEGNGFTLLSKEFDMWGVSKISGGVKFNECNYIQF